MRNHGDKKPFPGFQRNYIRNFFIYPNILEEYWEDMSGSEAKVLTFILRQTIGFRKKCDYISLSQFSKGIGGKSKNRGTGLSISQVRRAIEGLEEKGFITVDRYFNRPSRFCLEIDRSDEMYPDAGPTKLVRAFVEKVRKPASPDQPDAKN